MTGRQKVQALGTLVRLGAFGRRPALPVEELVRGWRTPRLRHNQESDAAAVSHHYDVGNDFYALVLGPRWSYSCAYWAQQPSRSHGLDEAQQEKLDLVCRKLALRPGQRMLDVGCGGAAWCCTPPVNTVCAPSVSPFPPSKRPSRGHGSLRPGSPTGWRSGCRTTGPSTTGPTTPSRPWAWPSTSARSSWAATPRHCTRSSGRGDGCCITPSPHAPSRPRPPSHRGRRSSTAMCSPTVSSYRSARRSPHWTRRALSYATWRTCVSTTH